jgi:hypothetical protein
MKARLQWLWERAVMVLIWGVMISLLLAFIAITVFPFIAVFFGWATVEVDTPGPYDCNPNWNSPDAC